MIRIAVTILVLGVVVGLATLTFVRPSGDETNVPEDPRRIVSLGRSLTEMVVALGAEQRLVGATIYCQGIDEDLPRVGTFLQPDFEAIVRLKPDVVLAVESKGQAQLFEGLARYDIPVERLPGDSISDLRVALERLGGMLSARSKAREIREGLDEALEQPTDTMEARRSVLFVVDQRPLFAAGAGSFVNEMIEAAGAKNVLPEDSGAWVPLEMEDVIRLAPDVIVDVTLARGKEAPDHRSPDLGPWAGFSEHLSAVRSNRVFSFPQVHVGVQIPDWMRTLRQLLQDTGD